MLYDRKIKYLDYYEGGSKVSGGGYAKLEMRDGLVRLDITVRGLHPTDSFERDIMLQGAAKEQTLGQIRIQNGNGQFRYSCNTDKGMGDTDISYGEITGIRIPIGGSREIFCRWGDESDKRRSIQPEEDRRNADSGKNIQDQIQESGKQEISAAENREPEGKEFQETVPEAPEALKSQETESKESGEQSRGKTEEEAVRLLEDKWQQLSAIYPHIQPFQDERDYLSLTPSDFVMFPNRFYRAVNNSFLLHGYYNYHHLILARVERRGEILYYIGVPGNYFEREKQVAVMFGFESFECKTEPAKTGDFGYYMMRTEL